MAETLLQVLASRPVTVSAVVSFAKALDGNECMKSAWQQLARAEAYVPPHVVLLGLEHDLAVAAIGVENEMRQVDVGTYSAEMRRIYREHEKIKARKRELEGKGRNAVEIDRDVGVFLTEFSGRRVEKLQRERPDSIETEIWVNSNDYGVPIRGRADLVETYSGKRKILEAKVKKRFDEYDKLQVAIYWLLMQKPENKCAVYLLPECREVPVKPFDYKHQFLGAMEEIKQMLPKTLAQVEADYRFCKQEKPWGTQKCRFNFQGGCAYARN